MIKIYGDEISEMALASLTLNRVKDGFVKTPWNLSKGEVEELAFFG